MARTAELAIHDVTAKCGDLLELRNHCIGVVILPNASDAESVEHGEGAGLHRSIVARGQPIEDRDRKPATSERASACCFARSPVVAPKDCLSLVIEASGKTA
jgi:hypothetical protein